MISALVKGTSAVMVVGDEAFMRIVLSDNDLAPYWYVLNLDDHSWGTILDDDQAHYEQLYIERER